MKSNILENLKINKGRILIKLSGEALGENGEKYSKLVLNDIATQIFELWSDSFQIGLVTGGGNLFRGADLVKTLCIPQAEADDVGMLSTVLNGIILKVFLEAKGTQVRLMSATPMPQFCEPYARKVADSHMKKGRVVIFCGGLGEPCFTTDTVSAARSTALGMKIMIMAKNGVDGVYDKDPKKYDDAKKMSEVTGTFFLDERLKLADGTAIDLARNNNLPIKIVSTQNIRNFHDPVVGSLILPE